MQVFRPQTALLVLTALATASATQLQVVNKCDDTVQLYDNSAIEALSPGGTTQRTLAQGFLGMFRDGVSPQATRTCTLPISLQLLRISNARTRLCSRRVLHHGWLRVVRHQHHPHRPPQWCK
jgi:hypothetical protein